MLLVVDNEVDPDYRYFVEELVTHLDEYRLHDAAAGRPDLDGADGVIHHPELTDRLLERVAADFGWTVNELSFAETAHERTLANFERLAAETE